ncbi:LysR family transcriptional regulator [Kineococcus aurantiacus]|uniref:DNA-binding transcriptional LysR family regulator n=1 Tax=Kineococcus aurantiacus TaxID=37633 RepID=A0A7Y9J1C0_9ACTN|nr:LysR family transcriptional regulator [Kineococcus aurantiacus]NYD22914.1 DNA-binding transcriptional LysR family regulator [Kineococcus aurantiacus]
MTARWSGAVAVAQGPTGTFEPVQLRSFLAVAQTHSFTQAAARLGVRQSTVSQHLRKLEDSVGRQLVHRDTHSVALTPDGEAMIGFARSILASHEQAAAYFSGARPVGRLRIGMSDDLALTRLPQILRDFRSENPRVDLELTVDQSGTLHRRLENDRLDIFIGKRPPRSGEGELVKRERLVWVGNPSTRLDLTQPVPLAVYPSPSLSGAAMHEALDRVGIGYRSACVCRGVNGLIAAVAAGIGVSCLASSLVPVQLVALGAQHKLPELGQIDLVLLTNPKTRDRPASRALAAAVLSSGPSSLSRSV